MDPDYIDPELLKARARAKGNTADDVTVGPRPRLRKPKSGQIRMEDVRGSVLSGVSIATIGVRFASGHSDLRKSRVS